tara:strand:- start:400 stop:747 length:348 start_codon:yes stop_codon:yes gene_type:complete
MSEITLEDIRSMIRGKNRFSLISVDNDSDKHYQTWATLVQKVYPNTGDNLYETQRGMSRIRETLSVMEPNDFNKIVNTLKKYEVSGSVRPISGVKTYAYDKSRLDNRMYKRKRSN